MKTTQVVVLFIGLGLTGAILHLVRRDHLYIRQAFFWIVVAVLSFVLGIFPGLIDAVGGFFGIAYPPTLVLLAAIVGLVIKALLADLALTRVQRDVRRMNQRLALLEAGGVSPPDGADR